MIHDGRHKAKYRPEKADNIVLVKKFGDEVIKVRWRDVKQYVENPAFEYYLSVYQIVKLWGFPNAVGWANEDCNLIDAITALEIEQREIEQDEYKDNTGKQGEPNGEALNSLRTVGG